MQDRFDCKVEDDRAEWASLRHSGLDINFRRWSRVALDGRYVYDVQVTYDVNCFIAEASPSECGDNGAVVTYLNAFVRLSQEMLHCLRFLRASAIIDWRMKLCSAHSSIGIHPFWLGLIRWLRAAQLPNLSASTDE
jgi:hypothetical protein